MSDDALTMGQIIERLKSNLALAQVHAQAARIELRRKDEQIEAMAGELERLRDANRRLWAELAGREAGDEGEG